jgi:hypothetical protein
MMQEHRSTSENAPASQHINTQWRKGEALTLPFLNSKSDSMGICIVRL